MGADHTAELHELHATAAERLRVDDFTVSPSLERSLDAALARVAEETGFAVDHHRLDLVGTCASCA